MAAEPPDEAPIIRATNAIIASALEKGVDRIEIYTTARGVPSVPTMVVDYAKGIEKPETAMLVPHYIWEPVRDRLHHLAGLSSTAGEVQEGSFSVRHHDRDCRITMTSQPMSSGGAMTLRIEETSETREAFPLSEGTALEGAGRHEYSIDRVVNSILGRAVERRADRIELRITESGAVSGKGYRFVPVKPKRVFQIAYARGEGEAEPEMEIGFDSFEPVRDRLHEMAGLDPKGDQVREGSFTVRLSDEDHRVTMTSTPLSAGGAMTLRIEPLAGG